MAGSRTTTLDARLQSIAGRISKEDVEAAQAAAAQMDRQSTEQDMLQFNMFAEERQS